MPEQKPKVNNAVVIYMNKNDNFVIAPSLTGTDVQKVDMKKLLPLLEGIIKDKIDNEIKPKILIVDADGIFVIDKVEVKISGVVKKVEVKSFVDDLKRE